MIKSKENVEHEPRPVDLLEAKKNEQAEELEPLREQLKAYEQELQRKEQEHTLLKA